MTSIQNQSRLRVPPRKHLHKLLSVLQKKYRLGDRELELVFFNDAQIKPYYKKYFGFNKATDVIAFPINDQSCLGSIVISVETARRQAQKNHHSLWNEMRLLVIHGFLHLLGYDHAKPREAKKMGLAQDQLLKLTEGIA
jgi:probable rRNA maturation factor